MRETTTESPPQALVERLKDYDQEHVFALWDDLAASERHSLIADIETLDVPRTDRIIRRSLASHAAAAFDPLPDAAVSTVESRRPEEKDRWWKQGLKVIYYSFRLLDIDYIDIDASLTLISGEGDRRRKARGGSVGRRSGEQARKL